MEDMERVVGELTEDGVERGEGEGEAARGKGKRGTRNGEKGGGAASGQGRKNEWNLGSGRRGVLAKEKSWMRIRGRMSGLMGREECLGSGEEQKMDKRRVLEIRGSGKGSGKERKNEVVDRSRARN